MDDMDGMDKMDEAQGRVRSAPSGVFAKPAHIVHSVHMEGGCPQSPWRARTPALQTTGDARRGKAGGT